MIIFLYSKIAENHTCESGEQCEDSGYCYDEDKICNGVEECPNGDDEHDCDSMYEP